jgi:hypothetical protein
MKIRLAGQGLFKSARKYRRSEVVLFDASQLHLFCAGQTIYFVPDDVMNLYFELLIYITSKLSVVKWRKYVFLLLASTVNLPISAVQYK